MDETNPSRAYSPADHMSKMKRVMAEFAALEPVNQAEEETRADVEKDIRREGCLTWHYLCGMAEGLNLLVRMYPFAHQDLAFRACARVAICATAKLALQAIQEVEDQQGFPEELE